MSLSVGNITFDCADAQRVAAFWSTALGLPIDEGASPYFASIGRASADISPTWFFTAVPEEKAVKNRLHLDLEADDAAAEVARLVSLGASHVADKSEYGHAWSVMADVEGNEFCVSGPHDHPDGWSDSE